MPAAAQVPTLGIGWGSALRDAGTHGENLNAGCFSNLFLRASSGGGNVTVHLMAIPVSGPNRLHDLGVPAYVATGSAEIRTQSRFTHSLSTTATRVPSGNTICIGNNKIQQDVSVIRVLLMRGSGYTVDPENRSIDVRVYDLDTCASPDDLPENGGVVYKFNGSGGAWGTCRCREESAHPEVRRLATYDSRQSRAAWQAGLKLLGQKFHDPEYLYCDESPWKGLPQ